MSNTQKGQKVKQHPDIRSQLLPWIEQKLDAQERSLIDRHLEECEPCRTYFETVSAVLLDVQEIPGTVLVPDPYLASRIKAIAHGAPVNVRPGFLTMLAWGWRTAAFVLAVLLGVYIGEKLSVQQTPSSNTAVITSYSLYLGDGGLAERIRTVSAAAGEELQ